jgi:hypothetical protein
MGAILPFVPYLVVLVAVAALWVALLRRPGASSRDHHSGDEPRP